MLGSLLMARWLILYFAGTERAHVPSLVAAAVLMIAALLFWVAGLLGELFAINRRLLQDIQYMMRKQGAAADVAERAAHRVDPARDGGLFPGEGRGPAAP